MDRVTFESQSPHMYPIIGFTTKAGDSVEYGLSMANTNWDLAGLTDAHGRLGKPVGTGRVLIPRSLCIQEPYLVWDFGETIPDEPISVQPAKGLLQDFIKLWNSSPQAILRFARKHGVLLLDAEGQPTFHWKLQGREHLERWTSISRRACAVLNIAAAIKQGELGSAEDWDAIDPSIDARFPKTKNRFMAQGLSRARTLLQWELENWTALGRITLSIGWDNKHEAWRTEIDFGGRMFAALALQLLLTVADADQLFNCDGCKRPYIRPRHHRRPKPGQANFCEQCGRQAALRHADLRRKSRIREARRLHAGGMRVSGIANRLKATPVTVNRWVK